MVDKPFPGDLISELRAAFDIGLRQHFGDDVGALLAAVLKYHPGMKIDDTNLKQTIETDSGMILEQVVGDRVDGTTLQGICEAMIGSALIQDIDGVNRWAKEGEVRCAKAGPEWAATSGQWQWVLAHPLQFINCARAIKKFVGDR